MITRAKLINKLIRQRAYIRYLLYVLDWPVASSDLKFDGPIDNLDIADNESVARADIERWLKSKETK